MKTLPTLLLFLSLTGFTACSKEKTETSIQGKWQLVQLYEWDAYGGEAQWKDPDPSSREFLVFEPDRSFAKTTEGPTGTETCTGIYSFPSTEALSLEFHCFTGTYILPMRLGRNNLELYDQLRCGFVIRRYRSVQ